MKSEALIPQNASSVKEWDAFCRKRWETITHKVQEWWETIIPVYLQKMSESIQTLLNLSTLGRTVTIRMPWHVSSILPFLHVIQGGVSWWTDPNRAVLNKPSGFLVCTTGEEGGEVSLKSRLWSPVICTSEDFSGNGSKQLDGAHWRLSHIILFVWMWKQTMWLQG